MRSHAIWLAAHMLEIRDLKFLSALARHKHFAKAAATVGVSQPAFSMRIRGLEDRLGIAIVKRGNRFQGLTPEGEAILAHAKKILDDVRALEEDVLLAKGAVSGQLRFASIPTAAAFAARLAIRLHQAYPGIKPHIETASSPEIQQGIEDGSIDAGLTYADSIAGDLMDAAPLYDETYYLLTPDHLLDSSEQTEISWEAAAKLPLTLLEPKMHNRRIIDRVFLDIGVEPEVIAEAGAMSICVSMVCEGLGATVLPQVLVESLGPLSGTKALGLVEPTFSKSIALVSAARAPGLPTVEALKDVAIFNK